MKRRCRRRWWWWLKVDGRGGRNLRQERLDRCLGGGGRVRGERERFRRDISQLILVHVVGVGRGRRRRHRGGHRSTTTTPGSGELSRQQRHKKQMAEMHQTAAVMAPNDNRRVLVLLEEASRIVVVFEQFRQQKPVDIGQLGGDNQPQQSLGKIVAGQGFGSINPPAAFNDHASGGGGD